MILDSSSFSLFHSGSSLLWAGMLSRLLLLFFLRFSSISLHCSPFQFSFAFFMHLLMLLFTSLYFSDPSGSNCFFLNSLLLSHRSRISVVTQDFFVWWCLPRISLAVSVTAVLKVVTTESVVILRQMFSQHHTHSKTKSQLPSVFGVRCFWYLLTDRAVIHPM